MKSHLKSFLNQKQKAGALNNDFYDQVSIRPGRIKGIMTGSMSATIKEIFIVAKYFEVPVDQLLESDPIKVPENICEYCGNAFTPVNSKARFCSDKCRNKAHRKNK